LSFIFGDICQKCVNNFIRIKISFFSLRWTVPEIVIVISAMDFWVTKNVTGRLLVGLKWWEEIDEVSGDQLWVFECRVDENQNK